MIFLNSASSAAALVFYLPGVCTHTDTEGEQRKTRVRNILKSLEKNTILNEHPVVKNASELMHPHNVFLNSLFRIDDAGPFLYYQPLLSLPYYNCRRFASFTRRRRAAVSVVICFGFGRVV